MFFFRYYKPMNGIFMEAAHGLDHLGPQTVEMVQTWLKQADKFPTNTAAKRLALVLRDPLGLKFTVSFVDGVVRPEDYRIAADNFQQIVQFIPTSLPLHLRLALYCGAKMAPLAPKIVIPIARNRLRKMVNHLILDARPRQLNSRLAKIKQENQARLNVNLLGEAVLGKQEAGKRIIEALRLLDLPEVDYISLKVSSIVSPPAPWAFEQSVQAAKESLRPVFAKAQSFDPPKFINLDMEEYRDLHLTISVFTQLLDEPENQSAAAGIVLQAYLPDALSAMQELQSWAAHRVAQGGTPIKVRLVKGANLPLEKVQSDIYHWPLATFDRKQATDTQYKRVLEYALSPEHTHHIRLGIAGHNLFDIAFAWLLAQERGVQDQIEFEMLLGMAPHQVKAVQSQVGKILLYTPVVYPHEFDVAIAYLIRRLEEGASQDNFMSAVFELSHNTELFEREKTRFLDSLAELVDWQPPVTYRTQDRNLPLESSDNLVRFQNTPDSDPATRANISWSKNITADINSPEFTLGTPLVTSSQVSTKLHLDTVISQAISAAPDWARLSFTERAAIFHRAAALLEQRRGQFIAVMAQETGKTIDQADPEISEAIDFAHFYAQESLELAHIAGANFIPDQLILVTSPWNFPVAIPCGSTIAALVTGASVILKPAPQANRCAALIVQVLWDAGVPRSVLQLLIIDEDTLGKDLISERRINRIILTGSYDTAALFRSFNPIAPILAETSGKNAIIVTPHADYDLAVKDIIASAFGHAGQKCSAASILILVGSVATSQRFQQQLIDAASSLTVGYPVDPVVKMGPIIESAQGKLLRGLTSLDAGESWLLAPQQVDASGRLWTPGIKTGVKPGSWFHMTELFGPVLGIMTAKNLAEAIALQNAVDYGLTAGLHSLNRAEIVDWINQVQAGNLYVNRGITGAIVQRQPFGGWKKSMIGSGYKAGGPNYLFALGSYLSAPLPDIPYDQENQPNANNAAQSTREEIYDLLAASLSSPDKIAELHKAFAADAWYWDNLYSQVHDISGLEAEQNLFRYIPVPVHIHLCALGDPADLIRVCGAGLRTRAKLTVSSGRTLDDILKTAFTQAQIPVEIVKDEIWAQSVVEHAKAQRIRLIGDDGPITWRLHKRIDLSVHNAAVTTSGRLELLHFFQEQAISITAHRFGNPIDRIELA